MRPHDSLWDGAHDARLTGDVVDEILGGKVDRADWSVAPDDPGTGARPRHKLSLPYPAFSSCPFAQVDEDDATRIFRALTSIKKDGKIWERWLERRGFRARWPPHAV